MLSSKTGIRIIEVDVVEYIVELRAEFIVDAFRDSSGFKKSKVGIEVSRSTERVLTDVSIGADLIGRECGGIEPLSYRLRVRPAGAENGITDVGHRQVWTIGSNRREGVIVFGKHGKGKA